MKNYRKVYAAFYKISKAVAYISMISMLIITVLTTVDVVLRLISQATSANLFVKGTFEFTQLFMILMVFFAYSITELDNGHVNVVIVTEKLPAVPKHILNIIVRGIVLVFCFIFTYTCWLQTSAHIDGAITSSVLFIPFTPFSLCMTIGAALFTVSIALKFINSIITLIKKDDTWEEELVNR
jgi:TRAP-type C4-dicarboxylate transport system, small permease component